jgi:DNA-binding beta-propeller fold protein YncE
MSRAVRAPLTTQSASAPRAVAVSPKTGDAYVTNGYLGKQSVWVMSD